MRERNKNRREERKGTRIEEERKSKRRGEKQENK